MLRGNSSVKGCVNDVSECRNNCRRDSLKEMRWNRIKRTSSRMTGKDEFMALFHCMVRHGSLLGGFPLGTVPGTWYFFSTTSVEVPSSRTVTKTWRVNSADHWMAGENRHYCVTELATRDPPLQPDPLDLNQHSQRRIGRNFCLNKRTFLHQPQNSSVVVCWGSSDVPLVDSRGADPARAWWCDAEGKSLMYNVTFELAIFSEYVFCLYFYLCICVLLQLKTIWSNKCTSRLY